LGGNVESEPLKEEEEAIRADAGCGLIGWFISKCSPCLSFDKIGGGTMSGSKFPEIPGDRLIGRPIPGPFIIIWWLLSLFMRLEIGADCGVLISSSSGGTGGYTPESRS